jgi:methylenetetrahydrofolate reductase (NADPH)
MGGGFATSTELIRFIKTRGPFCVGAACFPEGHVDARFKRVDWDYTAGKVEAGADFLISQLFYDWSDFLDMWDYLRNRRDVRVPIVPGILPFLSGDQIRRFAGLCGARLPKPLLARIDKYGSDEESVRKLGVEVCTELCRKLLDAGVPGFHFYCLNRVQSVAELVKNLS